MSIFSTAMVIYLLLINQVGGQIVKAHNVCVFLSSLILLAHVPGIVSVDTIVLKHLFFVNSTRLFATL